MIHGQPLSALYTAQMLNSLACSVSQIPYCSRHSPKLSLPPWVRTSAHTADRSVAVIQIHRDKLYIPGVSFLSRPLGTSASAFLLLPSPDCCRLRYISIIKKNRSDGASPIDMSLQGLGRRTTSRRVDVPTWTGAPCSENLKPSWVSEPTLQSTPEGLHCDF